MRMNNGLRMMQVANFVRRNPGCTMLQAAEHLIYRGRPSRRYGYAAVHRAIAAGLIVAIERVDKRGCYQLWPPSASEPS